jgi:peptide-O-fucosyltransferase
VLAFSGAPAAFPILERDVELHKYFKWSSLIENEADKFIKEEIGKGPFLGIHLRNGADWVTGH